MEVSKKEMSYYEDTELRLGLPGADNQPKKRVFFDVNESTFKVKECHGDFVPLKKVQAIGWPPIRSFRKNCLQATKVQYEEVTTIYVKVSMDGAPYLRKIDLRQYKGYKELLKALEDLFQLKADVVFKGSKDCKDNESQYKPTYEDKDGDWMLVGDVPWEMFLNSCRRLRIMKGSEAN